MLSVYKGRYVICNRGKVFKKHFVHVIKKLFFGLYLCKIYKKNTQYYNINSLKYLQKFIDIQIRKINNLSNQTSFLLSSIDRIKHSKITNLVRCMSKQDGSYIGCPQYTLNFINAGLDNFYYLYEQQNIAQIGYNSSARK